MLAENITEVRKRLNFQPTSVVPPAALEKFSHLNALVDIGRMVVPMTVASFGGVLGSRYGIYAVETLLDLSPAATQTFISKLPPEVGVSLLLGALIGGASGILTGLGGILWVIRPELKPPKKDPLEN